MSRDLLLQTSLPELGMLGCGLSNLALFFLLLACGWPGLMLAGSLTLGSLLFRLCYELRGVDSSQRPAIVVMFLESFFLVYPLLLFGLAGLIDFHRLALATDRELAGQSVLVLLSLVACYRVDFRRLRPVPTKVKPAPRPVSAVLAKPVTPAERQQSIESFYQQIRPNVSAPSPQKLRFSRRVGAYGLVSEIGEGSFGKVYKAVELENQVRLWAVKEMRMGPNLEAMREYFDQEQKVLSWLSHPNIVARRDFFLEGNSVYLVMEYVPGPSLRQVIRTNREAFSPNFTVGIAEQVCEALAYLHSQKPKPIVFRDLKPENLMLSQDGRVKLIDFGICRLSETELSLPTGSSEEATTVLGRRQDSICLGTPGYAAPEQYPDSPVTSDSRADVYALGVLMWELLSGQRPPSTPGPLPALEWRIKPELQAIVSRATALPREERFSSSRMMLKELTDYRVHQLKLSADNLSTAWLTKYRQLFP